MPRINKLFILSSASLSIFATSAFAKTEIQFWHAMSGQTEHALDQIVSQFNKSQKEYEIKPINKGDYQQTMVSGIAAFRAKKQPDIIQVYEVGTANMMNAQKAIVPVSELMQKFDIPFNTKDFIPAVFGYYSSEGGTLFSFPFNSSSPVMYYNRDIFKKAGLDPNSPPKTWDALVAAAKTIKEKKAADCGFSTAWPSWIQLENFSAWHNLSFATEHNGMIPEKTPVLNFNGPTQIRHWQRLETAYKGGYFSYFGRTDQAQLAFTSKKCGIIFESSGSYGEIKNAHIDFSVAPLPYDSLVAGAPQNTIIGGASLWAFSGTSQERQKGVAQFFAFLMKPEIMAEWHQLSGYLPVTLSSYKLSQTQGFYKKNVGFNVAIEELSHKSPTDFSKGLRILNLPSIRDVVESNFESMLGGNMTARQALDNAVSKGNQIITNSLDRSR